MKKLLLALVMVVVMPINVYAKSNTTCDAYVSAKNEVTFYDKYDGNVYDANTNGIAINTKVRCEIDTKGTTSIYDDEITSITIIK